MSLKAKGFMIALNTSFIFFKFVFCLSNDDEIYFLIKMLHLY